MNQPGFVEQMSHSQIGRAAVFEVVLSLVRTVLVELTVLVEMTEVDVLAQVVLVEDFSFRCDLRVQLVVMEEQCQFGLPSLISPDFRVASPSAVSCTLGLFFR